MDLILAVTLMAGALVLASRLPLYWAWPGEPLRGLEPAWGEVISAMMLLTLVLNASLWAPTQVVAVTVLALAVVCAALVVFRGRHAAFKDVIPLLASCMAAVALAACVLWGLFRIGEWWLLEGPNHDSLFYYEGTAWAWRHAIRATPAEVAATWGLGTCTQGGVFIGTDCPVLRNGTYSLLAFATAFLRPASANVVQGATAIAAVLPALGVATMLPLWRHVRCGWVGVALLAVVVFLGPGSVGALTNANLATAFGAAAIALTFGLAAAPCDRPCVRAAAMGLSTAIAGHLYGEAAVVAGAVAATGVVADAIRLRHYEHVAVGGFIALGVCLVGLNVVAFDLVHSLLRVNQVATGGDWSAWFIHGSGWKWIAAPYAGIVLGLDPPVSGPSFAIGATLALLTVTAGLSRSRTRVLTLGVLSISSLMVGYVESRNYAYGEHKIIQLLGPLASMLTIAVAAEYARATDGRRRLHAAAIAAALMAALLGCLIATHSRAAALLRYFAPLHGLMDDFSEALAPIARGDAVLVDDTGAVSVERFQKTHYLGFLLHARGSRLLMPSIDDDQLRGGYLRNVRGTSLRAETPRWVVRLRASSSAAWSPMKYIPDSVSEHSEFDLIDLKLAKVALAAGNGWYQCEATHCWTRSPFDVEIHTGFRCGGSARVAIYLEFFEPPSEGRFTVQAASGSFEFASQTREVALSVPEGWSKITVASGWPLKSPADVGLSKDSRLLFARVNAISASCEDSHPKTAGG